jgi:polyketide biosynthesis acyl carrier protein
VEPAEISLEQHLADLGCNSIDRAEIVTLTMEELAVTVPIMEFSEVNNIRTLVELFRRYLP